MITAIIVLGILLALMIVDDIRCRILIEKQRQEKWELWRAIQTTLEKSKNNTIGD